MGAYHAVLVHFPIALLMTATLAILVRAVFDNPLARAIDRALVPLLTIGVLSWSGRFRRRSPGVALGDNLVFAARA